jgi:hypothetical protein
LTAIETLENKTIKVVIFVAKHKYMRRFLFIGQKWCAICLPVEEMGKAGGLPTISHHKVDTPLEA